MYTLQVRTSEYICVCSCFCLLLQHERYNKRDQATSEDWKHCGNILPLNSNRWISSTHCTLRYWLLSVLGIISFWVCVFCFSQLYKMYTGIFSWFGWNFSWVPSKSRTYIHSHAWVQWCAQLSAHERRWADGATRNICCCVVCCCCCFSLSLYEMCEWCVTQCTSR